MAGFLKDAFLGTVWADHLNLDQGVAWADPLAACQWWRQKGRALGVEFSSQMWMNQPQG